MDGTHDNADWTAASGSLDIPQSRLEPDHGASFLDDPRPSPDNPATSLPNRFAWSIATALPLFSSLTWVQVVNEVEDDESDRPDVIATAELIGDRR